MYILFRKMLINTSYACLDPVNNHTLLDFYSSFFIVCTQNINNSHLKIYKM